MQKSTTYCQSPNLKSRLKSQKTQALQKSYLYESPTYPTAREDTQRNSYMNIQIQKSRISQNSGFTSIKQKDNEYSNSLLENKQKSRYVLFKNLQQFDVQLKTQKGNLQKANISMKAFGIATFRGVSHAVNNHQIAAHIGLVQGYDGSFAALQLKKNFVNQLNSKFQKQKGNNREGDCFKLTEDCITSAFQNCKKELLLSQNNLGDDSGASFLSFIVYKGISFVANCGASGALCMTTSGKLLKLAEPHTTKNQQQVNRIIKEGGQFYQTHINLPFQVQFGIRGPLRVFPEGLTVTRTLGKSLSSSKKKQKTVSDVISSKKGILRELQINYIPTSQIRWLAILSSKIAEKINPIRIKELIQQEISKSNQNYNLNQAAQHMSKMIILQGIQLGAKESLSVLVIFGQFQTNTLNALPTKLSWCPKSKAKQNENKKTLTSQPRSLTYIGNRVNFVQVQNQQ